MKTSKPHNISWGENVIIADADYIDRVAFSLIVNFERMIGRHIPKADMAQWVECIGLDGGMSYDAVSGGNPHVTDVILVHDKLRVEMDNFNPGQLGAHPETEDGERPLEGQAFSGKLGEFVFHCVESDSTTPSMTKAEVMADILAAMADEPGVRRVMVVPDLEDSSMPTMEIMMPVLRHLDRACQEKRVTTFAMQPLTAMPCRTEILGYSLMAALGIRADEIKP
ncbi:MAG: DUF6621 family protein [Prevotella sp.]